jgi:hypothetical protein
MNTLPFAYTVLVTLLLLTTLFASSVKVFFTDDELCEMGVRLEPTDINKEGMAAQVASYPSG